ncbi:MAG: glycyl-radical enzyme activating protein [Thermoanaerobaculales bacterium]|jgi:pyruvate formate lyase activating enzyme|nr:glycyl-radical enzyme activating protein [Thermoanaerobaculales bacterium]
MNETSLATAATDSAIGAPVFNIQRCSIHDGPGIRTTVFLKGCPLRCDWCHNPESLIGRGDRWTVADLVAELERDRPFFDASGGGVTFSGGEPLNYAAFLADCLDACRERGLHTAVDTSGFAPSEVVCDIARRTDLLLYDLKHIDPTAHEARTGVANVPILDNLQELSGRTETEIWVRVPLIPGFNDDEENLEALASVVGSLPRRHPVFVLPYHAIGVDKWRRLGKEPPAETFRTPGDDEVAAVAALLRAKGLEVCIGGAYERAS